MKIKHKLLLQAIFLAVVPAFIVALIITLQANHSSFSALEKKSKEQLISLRELKKSQISSYLETINSQVILMSKNPSVVNATQNFINTFQLEDTDKSNIYANKEGLAQYYQNEFSVTFEEKNKNTRLNINTQLQQLDDVALHFQSQYIAKNRFPLGSKDKLNAAGNSQYDQIHQQYHPVFRDYLNQYGYYDIFIVNAETGHIIYSVFKELDYATSLKTGPFADTGIADAFNKALRLSDSDQTVLVDFASYLPSYNQAASFIASPIKNAAGQTDAVLIFQMPIDGINKIMTNNAKWQEVGLGLSGETYLVGPDKKLRSESRFLIEDKENYFKALIASGEQPNIEIIKSYNSALGLQFVETPGANMALGGKSGFLQFPDYRNVEVLSAFTSINYGGSTWALIAEIDVDEAFADAVQLSDDLLFYGLTALTIIALLSIVIGFFIAKYLVTPINILVKRITDIAEGDGDLTVQLSLAKRNDEIGDVGKAFNTFVAKIRNIIIEIDMHANQLASSSEELSAVTLETNNIVLLQNDKTKITTDAMSEFNVNINEIADNSLLTANLTNEANEESIKGASLSDEAHTAIIELVNSVNSATNEIEELNSQVGDIGGILSVIESIAGQTNLLALNAAIEAARAGESGRGFSVVADEVRTLAGKTQESTVEIQQKIEQLKLSSNKSVTAMKNAYQEASHGIELVMKTANSIKSVSTLISEVSMKNTENATVAKQQSVSVSNVHGNIIEIAEYTESSSSAAIQTSQSSEELATLAFNMSSIVQQFKY
ncbi:MAG: methyl-accepting chemotaxis protein [Alteromonadaceae bacterium]|nr:methyl-accepting chemotaxis protein [Alteromonadaceae bacterium]